MQEQKTSQIEQFPEINMNNYNEEDVSDLNEWGKLASDYIHKLEIEAEKRKKDYIEIIQECFKFNAEEVINNFIKEGTRFLAAAHKAFDDPIAFEAEMSRFGTTIGLFKMNSDLRIACVRADINTKDFDTFLNEIRTQKEK